ncbi:hypothetical protein UPYG_G00297190 [Umbra pygmaea]|uniref:Ig-like domain-containing protein n=1 Tax=Umbra pygmaea TaxID=75934 RepID=A0ABD0WA16_UMBPY
MFIAYRSSDIQLSPQQSEAIVIYTGWERHALIGSDIRLSCSFFSWRWTSDDVNFSWSYRPDGARDSISIFHYTGGEAYLDNKGPFRGRLEFVGNPARRDGSILLKNLDYTDNGTFTCDAKNPPDIVGRPSSVRLLVFEKGEYTDIELLQYPDIAQFHEESSVWEKARRNPIFSLFWSFFCPRSSHYTEGEAYLDNKALQGKTGLWGNPAHGAGSILLKNLDYADNGTFTCDAKNPPDIVGRPSSVRLLVFEEAPQQSEAIVIYTEWERHASECGSDIRLSCSFFSWRRTSDNVTFSWYYQPDGARDSISPDIDSSNRKGIKRLGGQKKLNPLPVLVLSCPRSSTTPEERSTMPVRGNSETDWSLWGTLLTRTDPSCSRT